MASRKHQDQDVAAIRADIATTRAEIDAVQRAPLPFAEAEAAMLRLLDRAAELYDPAVRVFAHDPDPQLNTLELLLPDTRFGAQALWSFLAATGAREALVALWRDRLRQAYEIDPTLADAISLADRPARLADLRTRLW